MTIFNFGVRRCLAVLSSRQPSLDLRRISDVGDGAELGHCLHASHIPMHARIPLFPHLEKNNRAAANTRSQGSLTPAVPQHLRHPEPHGCNAAAGMASLPKDVSSQLSRFCAAAERCCARAEAELSHQAEGSVGVGGGGSDLPCTSAPAASGDGDGGGEEVPLRRARAQLRLAGRMRELAVLLLRAMGQDESEGGGPMAGEARRLAQYERKVWPIHGDVAAHWPCLPACLHTCLLARPACARIDEKDVCLGLCEATLCPCMHACALGWAAPETRAWMTHAPSLCRCARGCTTMCVCVTHACLNGAEELAWVWGERAGGLM
eukprot:364447-Chlamydomonas_euryale.AAC.29